MMKKVLPVVLSGAMIFSGCMNVFAADAAADESEVSQELAGDMDELGDLLGSLGIDMDAGLNEIMNAFGGEDSELGNLMSSFGVEAGNLDELLSGLGLGELSDALLDENGALDLSGFVQELGLGDFSAEDFEGIGEMFKDPEALKGMLAGLFEDGEMGTAILDMIGSEGGALESVVESMKSEDGEYDFEKIEASLETIEQSDNGIVINGIEVSGEEISKAAQEVIGAFVMMSGLETESEAA